MQTRLLRKIIAVLTLHAFLGVSLLMPTAQAGIVSTDAYVRQEQVESKRAEISAMLQREDLRERMVEMGVDPATVGERVAALSDAEVMQMSERMEEMPAGAGVLEVLLVVFLVFVILDIAGVTDVFPFIDEAK